LGIKDEYLRSTIDNLRDHQWKKVRTAVTPAFSSGKVKKVTWIENLISITSRGTQ